jgi:hypothetical protein
MAAKNGNGTDKGLDAVGVVLAAIGGGIGILGFVAFFGGAILWVRMDEVGVPANEAIATVPRSVLVTTGAGFLVPSVLLAIVLLGLLYMAIRGIGRLIERLLLRQQKKELNKAKTAAGRDPDNAGRADDVAKAKEKVERRRGRKKRRIERLGKTLRFAAVALSLMIAAAPGVLLSTSTVGLGIRQIVLLVVAWGFLTAICTVILASKDFAWFSLAIVVSVGLLNGFITYSRTKNDPKVEPAAVLRSNGAPVFGYFVAQTSDRIYLATWLPTGPLRLDAIPREEVTDMAVGNAIRRGPARIRARRLARQMCVVARQRPVPGPTVAATEVKQKATAESCTLADLRRLTNAAPNAGGTPAA